VIEGFGKRTGNSPRRSIRLEDLATLADMQVIRIAFEWTCGSNASVCGFHRKCVLMLRG
jgi:hypothetical protein